MVDLEGFRRFPLKPTLAGIGKFILVNPLSQYVVLKTLWLEWVAYIHIKSAASLSCLIVVRSLAALKLEKAGWSLGILH